MYILCRKCDTIKNIKKGYKVKYIGTYKEIRQVKAVCPKCGTVLVAEYKV